MAKHILGLVSIELSAIAGDGGVGTAFAAIGDTVPGSAVFANEEGTTQDFFIEEADTAIESIISDPGATTFTWSTFNFDAAKLVILFGGTNTSGTYTPPDAKVAIEQSIKATDKKGNILTIVRAVLKPKFTMNFNKTALGQIDIVATILTPTKAATKPWSLVLA